MEVTQYKKTGVAKAGDGTCEISEKPNVKTSRCRATGNLHCTLTALSQRGLRQHEGHGQAQEKAKKRRAAAAAAAAAARPSRQGAAAARASEAALAQASPTLPTASRHQNLLRVDQIFGHRLLNTRKQDQAVLQTKYLVNGLLSPPHVGERGRLR